MLLQTVEKSIDAILAATKQLLCILSFVQNLQLRLGRVANHPPGCCDIVDRLKNVLSLCVCVCSVLPSVCKCEKNKTNLLLHVTDCSLEMLLPRK